MELQSCSTLRVLIAGQQTSFDHVLAANVQCWGYKVKMTPTTLPLLGSDVDYDVLLYDMDEAIQLSTLLGGKDTRYILPESRSSSPWDVVQGKAQWSHPYVTIALSSRSISRATLEQMGAVALLLKPFEMGELQHYLRVMQRLLLEPEAPQKGNEKGRILVVDDDAAVVNIIRQLLLSVGYEVAIAHNGLDALELCLEWQPMCIVTDVIMPWMNGYQVMRCLAAGALRTMPAFVITSALAELEVPVNSPYMQGIAVTYVNKPFAIDHLLTAIEQVCSERVS